jgi:hypothetical protein
MAMLVCGLLWGHSAGAIDNEVDEELIEFLGSWDDAYDEWQEFFDAIPQELLEGQAERQSGDGSESSDSD